MYTLYQRTEEVFDLAGQSVGWQTKPVLFPDTFFLYSGLKYNWDEYTVEYKKKVYEFGHLLETDSNLPAITDWLSVFGNSIVFEYYKNKTEEYQDNPSGNVDNVNKMYYKSGIVDRYIIKHKYDKADHCIVRISLEPKDGVATVNTNGYSTQIQNKEQDLNDLLAIPNYGVSITEQEVEIQPDETSQSEQQGNSTSTPQPATKIIKKVAVTQKSNCVLLSHNENMYPVLTDALIMTETDAKMIVTYTNTNWELAAVTFTTDNVVVSEIPMNDVTPETEQITPIEIFNQDRQQQYVALVFSHNSGQLPSIGEISQEALGLTVDMKKWRILTFVNFDAENNDKTENYISGEQLTLDPLEKEGYIFDGWFSSDDESNVTPLKSIVVSQDLSVYARWRKIVKIKLYNIDGKGKEKEKTCYQGDSKLKNDLKSELNYDNSKYVFDDFYYYENEIKGQSVSFPLVLEVNDVDIYCGFTLKPIEEGGGNGSAGI